MSENKNDMSFADMIARVNRHNMQTVADAHNQLLKRVEVLEQENKEQEDNIKRLEGKVKKLEREYSMIWEFFNGLADVKRVEALEERLKTIEEKIEGYVFE